MTPIRVTGAKEGPGGHASYEFEQTTGQKATTRNVDTTKHCDNCGEVWDPEAEGAETCPDCQPGDIGALG